MGRISPKWSIGDVSAKGHQASGLLKQYQAELQNRIKAEEVAELENGLRDLESSRAGQKGNLQGQKSATKSKEAVTQELHTEIIDIREMVKAAPGAKQEILKAFGVGISTHFKSQPKTISAANMIITGYNKYSEWAQNSARILEEDVIKIETLRDQLIDSDKSQENVKLFRKLGTVDKNALQIRLEQLITMVSAIGVKVFRSDKPALVPLFQALIPGSVTANVEKKEEETVTA